jgi:hypothetical protein
MWKSEAELREYIYKDGQYEKLLKGEIGINLIQTHTAMSLAVIGQWVEYVFRTARMILGLGDNHSDEMSEQIQSIEAYCSGRVHNIWGSNRNEDNPEVTLHFDIAGWLRSPTSASLADFKFIGSAIYRFSFPDSKKEEMAAQIKRYGTTTTGIGRIMAQMGRDRIWREPEVLRSSVIAPAVVHASAEKSAQISGL